MFKACCASMVAALLGASAGSAAAQAPATDGGQKQVNAKPAGDPNEIVCEKQEATGTRLGARRVCMTRTEWAERRLQDRQDLERVQVHRGSKAE